MKKTGESYTAARLQVVEKKAPRPAALPDYAALAGMSDASVKRQTGHDWAEWVSILDAIRSVELPHREIARYVASRGTASWWTQTVTVGYERIRGLREVGQRRNGGYEANKSRTFRVPLHRLFAAVAEAPLRAQWLPAAVTVRSATPNKAVRITWDDGTPVEIRLTAKAADRSALSVQHTKLPDKAAAERMKAFWSERLDALTQLLA
jgi:uncharacterized protein YndB with AHSA1/START domain